MYHMQEMYNGVDFRMERDGDLYIVRVYDEKDRQIGRCKGNVVDVYLNGTVMKAMALGALMTMPEYRRLGMARHTFEMLYRVMEERGCILSYLHPFSFNYYRSIGYERIADHRIIEFPIDRLDFVPRYPELEHIIAEDSTLEMEQVYNEFCRTRNAGFLRRGTVTTTEPKTCAGYTYGGPYTYNCKGVLNYLSRDEEGKADGYIIFRKEMDLTHHHLFGKVLVDEICYTSPEALRKLLGFIRMYDGEVDTVIFNNCGMAPEVEQMLRDYKYIKIQSVPDLCARFHDVQAVLEQMVYPQVKGEFTVKVTDPGKLPFPTEKTVGTWNVVYEKGKAAVTKLPDDAACDLELEMSALAQLVHGFQSYGKQTAQYAQGVVLHNDCDDFFRAFPNRPCGLYDLF